MFKDQIFFNTNLRLGRKNRFFLLILGLSIGIFFLPSSILEKIYGGMVYPLIRIGLNLVAWIPFPLIYILILLIPGWIYYLVKSKKNWKVLVVNHLRAVVWLVVLFYWLWAFNYKRTEFESRFKITLPKIDSAGLSEELSYALYLMLLSRPGDPNAVTPLDIEHTIRPDVKKICRDFGYHPPGRIRVKALYPKGSLLRIKTAGFYLPYTGEAYVDAGLHPLQLGFTMAHEMCHGFGVTDEGACNFLAFLATQHSADSSMRYSGAIGYFRYVAGTYRYYFPESYQLFRQTMPKNIQNDLDEINAAMRQYPDLFPKLRDQIYDNYLKLQGIKEGMSSYDNIIDLVRQARSEGLL